MKRLLLIMCALLFWTTAFANAPETSLRPLPRPNSDGVDVSAEEAAQASAAAVGQSLQISEPALLSPEVSDRLAVLAPGLRTSPRPDHRPRNFRRIVRRAEREMRRNATRETRESRNRQNNSPQRGSVCGDRTIRGERIAAIPGRLRGCGVAEPVRVTEIDGVLLTQGSTLDCETATALKRWINEGVRPAVGRRGGGVASLRVVAHYACRTRNNQAGARISEHGRGKAIDIAAINLRDGSTLSVLQGWRDPQQSRALRQMHAAACGPFATVLGPNANRYHQDHFHFDTARHRGGSYCR